MIKTISKSTQKQIDTIYEEDFKIDKDKIYGKDEFGNEIYFSREEFYVVKPITNNTIKEGKKMKKISMNPNLFGKNIEDRRYCGKCGKTFSVFKSKKDKNNRIASPCCENVFNNEIICQYDVDKNCPLANTFMPDCGSNCTKYREAKIFKSQ